MGKVLFIRGGAVGDFILTLPAIQLVREGLPGTEIGILGYEPIIELAKAGNLADETRSIEYGPLSSFFIPGTLLLPELMEYFKRFSVVVSYLYDPDGYFEDNLKRAGVETLIRGPHQVDETSPAIPAATQLAKPLEQLALFLEDPFVELRIDEAHTAAARRFLEGEGAHRPDRPLIALHPGSGSPRKNWSFEGWAEVAGRLHDLRDGNVQFLITSGEAEDTVIDQFLALLNDRGISFLHAQHQPLPVLSALIRNCVLYLGHDSGISHLAGTCGIPCLLLFGPTQPDIWAPKNPQVEIMPAPDNDISRCKPEAVSAWALERLEG